VPERPGMPPGVPLSVTQFSPILIRKGDPAQARAGRDVFLNKGTGGCEKMQICNSPELGITKCFV
jgi:hypothetical protein